MARAAPCATGKSLIRLAASAWVADDCAHAEGHHMLLVLQFRFGQFSDSPFMILVEDGSWLFRIGRALFQIGLVRLRD
jgi:hypothetical protein